MEDSRDEHCMDVAEDGEDNSNIRSLRWGVYTRDKEDFIKREFLVSVPHPKWGILYGLVSRMISSSKSVNTMIMDYAGLIIS